eukprot:1160196-Pelagomonas_calceolata.AAC.3
MATYQALFALPFDHDVRKPIRLQGYIHLDLSQHVMQNQPISQIRAVYNAGYQQTERKDRTHVYDQCSCGQIQDEVHVLFMCRFEGLCALRRKYSKLFWTPSGDFSPLLRQQLSVQAVSNFLLRHNKKLL